MLDQDMAAALCAITVFADVAALNRARNSSPSATLTFSFFHNVKALTGAAEQRREFSR